MCNYRQLSVWERYRIKSGPRGGDISRGQQADYSIIPGAEFRRDGGMALLEHLLGISGSWEWNPWLTRDLLIIYPEKQPQECQHCTWLLPHNFSRHLMIDHTTGIFLLSQTQDFNLLCIIIRIIGISYSYYKLIAFYCFVSMKVILRLTEPFFIHSHLKLQLIQYHFKKGQYWGILYKPSVFMWMPKNLRK